MGAKTRPVVAVVEDDEALRKALGRLIRAAGFEPVLFQSAEAYLEASPAPLCIVVDVTLEGMSGLELQERLRAAGTVSPTIMLTGGDDTGIRERAEQAGCVGFFQKPLDGSTLIATIESLANQAGSFG